MKRIFVFLASVIMTVSGFAQAPEKMSYQAVLRNSSDQLVVNKQVGMKISIQKYVFGIPPTYPNVYVETHTVNTDDNGLVTIQVGGGTVIGGDFATIDWSDGEYYIRTETDLTGGTSYTVTGRSQLLSVPYALYAKNVKNPKIYNVGDFAYGGIVFWVDETGQHGLVCAKKDQSTGIRWSAGTNIYTIAGGNGPLAGKMNTAIIIASQGRGDGNYYAARICNELYVTEGGKTYGDWYLPSPTELALMYQNKAIINATATANGGTAFASNDYWSSGENNNTSAWCQHLGSSGVGTKSKSEESCVRAVRAF
jgi:hypothetical protein